MLFSLLFLILKLKYISIDVNWSNLETNFEDYFTLFEGWHSYASHVNTIVSCRNTDSLSPVKPLRYSGGINVAVEALDSKSTHLDSVNRGQRCGYECILGIKANLKDKKLPRTVSGRLLNAKTVSKNSGRIVFTQMNALLQQNCHFLTKWIIRNNWLNIAFFAQGFEPLDILVIKELFARSSIHIGCVISDKKKLIFSTWKVKAIPYVFLERLDNIDVIVIPDPMIANAVDNMFRRNSAGKVVSVYSIILELGTYNNMYRLIQRLHGLVQRGIQTLVLEMPFVGRVKNRSKWERILCMGGVIRIEQHPDKFIPTAKMPRKYIYFLKNRWPYLKEHLEFQNYLDCESAQNGCVNVVNHIRPAVGICVGARHNVYIVGDSTAVGHWTMDEDTCASYLQRWVNEVVNRGGGGGRKACAYACVTHGGCSATLDDSRRRLRNIVIRSGDVVVVIYEYRRFTQWFEESCEENGVQIYNSQPYFNRLHMMGEVFYDRFHLSPNGNREIGRVLFEKIFAEPSQLNIPNFFHHYFCNSGFSLLSEGKVMEKSSSAAEGGDLSASPDFLLFMERLRSVRMASSSQVAGCIVMNCNPFTLGHLHLVDTAAGQVDGLYVFVLEEDRSEFLFVDRIELVRLNTLHFVHTRVLPSSRFIISMATMPEYFAKGEHPDAFVDASVDLEIFCSWIALALGARIRFVGEEPLDRVTLQYNNAMCQRLPLCGVQLCIVRRKEVGGTPISASRVWNLLSKRLFTQISSIVPEISLIYLYNKYKT